MFLGSANFGEAAHFVSTLGFFNLIFISFTPVILYFTKVEHWSSFAALPWGCLCGMAGLWLGEWPSLAFHFLCHLSFPWRVKLS